MTNRIHHSNNRVPVHPRKSRTGLKVFLSTIQAEVGIAGRNVFRHPPAIHAVVFHIFIGFLDGTKCIYSPRSSRRYFWTVRICVTNPDNYANILFHVLLLLIVT